MTRNDITGDRIASKPANDAFRNAFDRIFAKSSQCGDCGGTRKVGGLPCLVCAPTDDGPEERDK
jgi:hypothetical protein